MTTLQAHDVFDADTNTLQAELLAIKKALPSSNAGERQRLLALQVTIKQELHERGGSQELLTQLLPIIQDSNPDSWSDVAPSLLSAVPNAPSSLKQELEQLVQAGQRIQALRQAALNKSAAHAIDSVSLAKDSSVVQHESPPGHLQTSNQGGVGRPTLAASKDCVGQYSTVEQFKTANAAQVVKNNNDLVTKQEVHSTAAVHVLHPLTNAKSQSLAESDEAQGLDSKLGVNNEASATLLSEASASTTATESAAVNGSPHAHAPTLTPQEAALLAFREEQRKLHKARKVLLRPKANNTHSSPAKTVLPTQQLEQRACKAGVRQPVQANAGQPQPVNCPVPCSNGPPQKQADTTLHRSCNDCPEQDASIPPHAEALPVAETSLQGEMPGAESGLCAEQSECVASQHAAVCHAAGENLAVMQVPEVITISSVVEGVCGTSGNYSATSQEAVGIPSREQSRSVQALDPLHDQHDHRLGSESSNASSYEYHSGSDTESPTRRQQDKMWNAARTPRPDCQRDSQTPVSVYPTHCHQPPLPSADVADLDETIANKTAMPVDRWAHWDLADLEPGGGDVSAWGREAREDPIARHMQAMPAIPRAPAHQPPANLADKAVSHYAASGMANTVSDVSQKQGVTQPSSISANNSAQVDIEHGNDYRLQDDTQVAGTSFGNGSNETATVCTPLEPQTGFMRQGMTTTLVRPISASRPSQPTGQVPNHHACEYADGSSRCDQDVTSLAAVTAPASNKHHTNVMPIQKQPTDNATTCINNGASVYTQHYTRFSEIFTAFRPLVVGSDGNSHSTASRAAAYPASTLEIQDKCKGVMLRLSAWMDAEASNSKQNSSKAMLTQQSHGAQNHDRQQASQCPTNSTDKAAGMEGASCRRRYYAVVDDTLHPEVRQVLNMALAGQPGWSPDPIDQLTEIGKPDDVPADTPQATDKHEGTTQNNTSPFAQQKSPLVGRCNMWNLLWSWSLKVRAPLQDLLVWQRVNHFPEAKQLTRKDLLAKHLQRYQVMHGSNMRLGPLFSCLPTTFTLPRDAAAFADAFARASHGVETSVSQPDGLNLWIVKPVGLSRGRGIRLIRSLRDMQSSGSSCSSSSSSGTAEEPLVVQRYVTNPMTVQGYKFDLRLFILVTSFNPLEAWLCREGFARFATQPFSLETDQLTNRLVHLTNSSVQKEACTAGLPAFLADAQPYGASKCSLTTLQALLLQQGIPWAALWSRITEQLIACLFAAQDAIPACHNAFEVFGADVLLDSNGRPWLLEVNSSPSLSIDTPLDRVIKPRMIRDAIGIVDPQPFDREALLEVLADRTAGQSRTTRKAGIASSARSAQDDKQQMCADLQHILGGVAPRLYGQTPSLQADADDNWFTCIAPSPLLDKLKKLKK